MLIGGAGNDNLSSGGGAINDTLVGGDGDDRYVIFGIDAVVIETAGQGFDQVNASASYALTAGNEIELLTTTLPTGTVAIDLTGNEFGQTIVGNAGSNILDSGGGDDTLIGNAGNDTFVFRAGFGDDIVGDFTAGAGTEDAIEFHDGIFADFAAVLAASQQVGSDVVITVDAANSVTLQNVSLANLSTDDFRFF